MGALYPPTGRVQFIALVDLDRGPENCIGMLTATFNDIDVHYLTYDSKTANNLPARIRKSISLSKTPSTKSVNIVVVFEAHKVMFEIDEAERSVLARFSSYANHDSIYTPVREVPSILSTASGGNLLDCSLLLDYNFVGTAAVVYSYLHKRELGDSTIDRDCILQFDFEKLFFKKVNVDFHETSPLTSVDTQN